MSEMLADVNPAKLPVVLPTNAVPLVPYPLPTLPPARPKSIPVAVAAVVAVPVPVVYVPPKEARLNDPLMGVADAVAAAAAVRAAVKRIFLNKGDLLNF